MGHNYKFGVFSVSHNVLIMVKFPSVNLSLFVLLVSVGKVYSNCTCNCPVLGERIVSCGEKSCSTVCAANVDAFPKCDTSCLPTLSPAPSAMPSESSGALATMTTVQSVVGSLILTAYFST